MPFKTVKFYEFGGQRRSLLEISKLTGISYWTIRKRAERGMQFDKPVEKGRPKTKPARPALTGDRDRDIEMIVGEMRRLRRR